MVRISRNITNTRQQALTHKIIFICGVSGSGKSTVGQMLSKNTGIPFFDGDDFHPPANIEKMKSGKALDDADRLGWLKALNTLARNKLSDSGAIIACSALKSSYREILRSDLDEKEHFIFLEGSFAAIMKRLELRKDHFMPESLLQAQFDDLEPSSAALRIDISLSPEQIAEIIISQVNQKPSD